MGHTGDIRVTRGIHRFSGIHGSLELYELEGIRATLGDTREEN